MHPDAPKILNKAIAAWNKAIVEMERMEGSSNVRPRAGADAIRLDPTTTKDAIHICVGPVVFNLPERANSGRLDLYIAVSGFIIFEADTSNTMIRTRKFGTNIGYFRNRRSKLEHVYGAHYDMDEEKPGHPVFHAQIGPQEDLADAIKELFHFDYALERMMGQILRSVRTPSAQMDAFAVITQICADHLVGEKPSTEVKTAFSNLRNASDFFVGAAYRLAYLNTEPATKCYRSKYWYEAPAANT